MDKVLSSPARLSDLIGARVRALRQARGFSVNSLASAAGVSAGIVSQIERERANPSLNTIEKICTALGVPTDAVLSTPAASANPGFVVRASDRVEILVGSAPILKEIISPQGNRSLRMMLITLPPRSENLDVVVGPGQKAGLVLEGDIRIVVSGVRAVLAAGDSFQFASDQPHSLHNDAGMPAKVLWIIAEARNGGAF